MTMTDMRTDYRTDYRTAKLAPRALFGKISLAGPRTIRQAIEEAADAIEDESIGRLWPDEAPPFAQARAVLGSLTLCYTRQIYSSADAACVIARDLTFPRPCGGELPDTSVLRRFREENRQAIHRCLTAALHFLLEQKISSGAVTRVNFPQVAEEANRRIIMAMFVDSMELEGERARANDPSA
jgi:hypothetical protein